LVVLVDFQAQCLMVKHLLLVGQLLAVAVAAVAVAAVAAVGR
jgi:hypothetical protein